MTIFRLVPPFWKNILLPSSGLEIALQPKHYKAGTIL
jgi:hypothetical protein